MIDYLYKARRSLFKKLFGYKTNLRKFSFEQFYDSLKNEIDNQNPPCLCLSWDDLCLPVSSVPFDYGQCEGKNSAWNQFLNFTLKNSDLTQFIFYIPKPTFTYFSDFSSLFTSNNFKDCCKFIEKRKNEIHEISSSIIFCIHGFNHNRKYPIDINSSMEFEFKTTKEVSEIFNKNKDLFNLPKHLTHFKPPAWSLGQLDNNFGALSAILKMSDKIGYIHIVSPSTSQLEPLSGLSKIHLNHINEMISIPQNINILWPKDNIKKVIDIIVSKGGIVNPQSHFIKDCRYIDDGISEKNLELLQWIIDYAKECGCKNLRLN
jgi:hypothetical protein